MAWTERVVTIVRAYQSLVRGEAPAAVPAYEAS